MYVLPPDYHYILRESGLMERYLNMKTSGILPDIDSNELDFTWAYCSYMWEAHINLPSIDVDLLNQSLQHLSQQNSSHP